MAEVFSSRQTYMAWLRVDRIREGHVFDISDNRGNVGSTRLDLDLDRELRTGGTWGKFLDEYREGKYAPSPADLAAFGEDLRRWLFDGDLAVAWHGIQQARSGQALHLTVEFGVNAEDVQSLPFELLKQDGAFLFVEPGSAVMRTFRGVPARVEPISPELGVLFAWACPPGCVPFDPAPHIAALRTALGEDRVTVVAAATLDAIDAALTPGKFAGLHVMAHGFVEGSTSGVVLHDRDGLPDTVTGQALAQRIRGRGVALAFLCACQSAVGTGMTGTGQHLLSPGGADLPWVVATQGNLAVAGSATLVERFYRLLRDRGDPGAALGQARRDAWSEATHYWSVPVLLCRPELRAGAAFRAAAILRDRPAA